MKIALISKDNIYLNPALYFPIAGGHMKPLKAESGVVSAQVENWSRIECGVKATKVLPQNNQIQLTNGKTFTYKALVLATGFDHRIDDIKGLRYYDTAKESEAVFIHTLDTKNRFFQNFWHGWMHRAGDLICYSPKTPYKGEGTDFYALYYESVMRQDKLQEVTSKGARVQYYTPNKEIFQFPYANEVALDECHKRGIDVCLGWEMIELKTDSAHQKIAVFKNVDTGAVMEKPYFGACINPPSKPTSLITDSGLGDVNGLVNVNKYTLQHNKYENIFAFGDCIGGFDHTRTMHAAVAQNSVIKNNVLRYLHG